ncbi:MAG TPA: HEAT repeat domain-containing protein [Vicinamibacterales bacterium]|nr:HEAT repeat domain-containing protein [Vicinamibacterales bacterium]
MNRTGILLAVALSVSACASAPSAPPPKTTLPPPPPYEQKLAWILRLEDQRVLHDQTPTVEPAPMATSGQKAALVVPPPPPDLLRLLRDDTAAVRRRAALAAGRVGLAEAIDPLVERLSDEEAEVREMAAFALGLIGDARASAPLTSALADPSPLVQSSAAEALGLIGDASAADAIGKMIAAAFASESLAQPPGEADDSRRDTATAAARLGIFALVRLKAYPQLAAAVLDDRGEPRLAWWPVAYALGRIEDRRALSALLTLARDSHPYTRAFAVKGLGALKDSSATPLLLPLVTDTTNGDRAVRIEAVRALGRIGDRAAVAPLMKIIRDGKADAQLRLEAVTAIGGVRADGGAEPAGPSNDAAEIVDTLLDVVADPSPPIRAAALRSVAALDPETFVTVLSGLDPDPHWSVRAALASTLATLKPESVLPRLRTMLKDPDHRVLPGVLSALVKVRASDAAAILLQNLKVDDAVVRAAAADGLGTVKPDNGAAALADAYRAGQPDATYAARAAALAAIAKYGAAAAIPVLQSALADKDWPVRVRAAQLLKELDPGSAAAVAAQIRPAPTTLAMDVYSAPRLVTPPVSTQLYIETDRGTIQVELAMIDAPLTVENFVTLARKGYFNGLAIHRVVPDFVVQDGDPRGDGEGGPGYTMRDELSERPYLRGVVGVALDGRDTGGSQWFITHSPQPHLDAKYTVFGRVVAGMDVVDQIQQWDVVRRVRVWDGENMTSR